MEEPESRLRNLYRTYIFKTRPDSISKLSKTDKLRWLGGMEALLHCVGKLPSGIIFDYITIKKTFLFIPYRTKETYQEYILRHCNEFITTSPNTPSLR